MEYLVFLACPGAGGMGSAIKDHEGQGRLSARHFLGGNAASHSHSLGAGSTAAVGSSVACERKALQE